MADNTAVTWASHNQETKGWVREKRKKKPNTGGENKRYDFNFYVSYISVSFFLKKMSAAFII